MIVTDGRVGKFVGDRCSSSIIPPFTCIGIERDGSVIAGVVFNVFTGPDVQVTVAGSGWTRGFLREVGRYVFGQLGCLRMTVETEQEHVKDIAIRFGGQVEGLKRHAFGAGRHSYVVGILRDDWKFK